MNNQTILDKCEKLKLKGVETAFKLQNEHPEYEEMGFNERLAELLDAQLETNSQRRIKTLTTQAKLRYPNFFLQDIDYKLYPNLKKHKLTRLANCDWISEHQNVSITGPTGTGKTTIACVLAQEAISRHIPVKFYRLSKLSLELVAAHNECELEKCTAKINRAPLLIIDDWGNALMPREVCHCLLELFEIRENAGSTIITSQYPVETWYKTLSDKSMGESVLDRLIYNTHKINLGGDNNEAESIRKLLGLNQGGRHE